jgi:hypothetical protein
LTKEFVAIARPEGDEMRMGGKDGKVLFVVQGNDVQDGLEAVEKAGQERAEREKFDSKPVQENTTGVWDDATRPEVDRGMLRQLFLDSIAPDTIKWVHKICIPFDFQPILSISQTSARFYNRCHHYRRRGGGRRRGLVPGTLRNISLQT